jgi:hypothetical protein
VLGQRKIHAEKLWTPDEFSHLFEELPSGLAQFQSCQTVTPSRKVQIERFSAGVEKFGQAFEWYAHSATEAGPSVRANMYSHHAAASRRFRVSDGPDLWNQGRVVFVPRRTNRWRRGRPPPQSANPTWLLQFGGRVFGGPGEAGTGSSVSAPG